MVSRALAKKELRKKANEAFLLTDEMLELIRNSYDEDLTLDYEDSNYNPFSVADEIYAKEEAKLYEPVIDHDDEEYLDVIENPNYMVSNYGKVFNKTTKQMLEGSDSKGYRRVGLKDENGTKAYLVHRLEAHAFFKRDDIEELQVNHKDGNKSNNYISNLEWTTPKENVQHAFANGLVHFTEETGQKHREVFQGIYPPVRCLENGNVYVDARAAAEDLGLRKEEIRKVCRGALPSYKGYHFENASREEINVW